ncbi:MAG: hypothetical protein EPN46_12125 [Candidimonas sp.]|nr:MAG: hypothetical protein EPN77_12995 [Candidimonas sp.]TAM19322.1 MAG: hypothetical protein EPN62_18620 [Candidimonas sp.]TAM74577.1 MAG: hypothetical protein EPN46_12125 [Candidimonas sp.]
MKRTPGYTSLTASLFHRVQVVSYFMITAPGFERLVTHIFRKGGEYLDSDAVFGVRLSLVADWVHHLAGKGPDGAHHEKLFHTLDFDFVLNPACTG